MRIRNASLEDLDNITSLEAACFPAAEAGSREDFEKRLKVFPGHFWVIEEDGRIASMVNGMTINERDLKDSMFEDASLHNEAGDWQMIFGVATHPDYQGRGYMDCLMRHVIEDTRKQHRKGLVLTCKDRLIPFYERFGFVSEGRSESVHGGAVWYQMRLTF